MGRRLNLNRARWIDSNIGIPLCKSLAIFDKFKRKFVRKKQRPIKKILLMKFWGFGNIILLSPTIKALKEKYPSAEIDFLTIREISTLLKAYPEINQIHILDIKTVLKYLFSAVKNLMLLRVKKYDLVFDFEQLTRNSALLAYLLGIPERVGFDIGQHGKSGLFTKKVPYDKDKHVVDSFYDLAVAIGCPNQKLKLSKINYNNSEKEKILFFLKNFKTKGPLVGIHVGSGPNAPGKQWPVENFAKLSDYLIQKFKARIVFTGTKDENALIKKTLSLMKNSAKNSAGLFNFQELACLISKCNLFIVGDTGPLHIAAAMSTPTISFFGLCSPKLYGPYGPKEKNKIFYKNLHCSPCITNLNSKLAKCEDIKCIKKIGVEEVQKAVDGFLKEK